MRNSITTRQGHLARTFGEGMNGVSSIEFVGWDAVPDEWIDEPYLPLYVASGITPDEWKAACAAIWKMRQEATDA